jgi:hypothetical protein
MSSGRPPDLSLSFVKRTIVPVLTQTHIKIWLACPPKHSQVPGVAATNKPAQCRCVSVSGLPLQTTAVCFHVETASVEHAKVPVNPLPPPLPTGLLMTTNAGPRPGAAILLPRGCKEHQVQLVEPRVRHGPPAQHIPSAGPH